jgi:Na+/melibiose symporter-like transporter
MGMPNRRDFRLFFIGQLTSTLGSSFTAFGLPLLVYTLTGSATNLAITTVCSFLPYLLFGLVAGTWMDRVDRRRAFVATSALQCVVVLAIPALWAGGVLSVWWLYAVAFTLTSLSVVTAAVAPSVVPALVGREDLARANGMIQGSFSVAVVCGPLLAGALVGGGLPLAWVFSFDAFSFLVVAIMISFIRTPFNAPRQPSKTTIRSDMAEGLRFVLSHSVLRGIAILAALYNLLAVSVNSQMVNYAHTRLGVSGGGVSLLFAAGSLGTAVMVYTAGRLGKRLPFRMLTLGSLGAWGGLVFLMSLSRWFWLSTLLWSLAAGMPVLFSVRTTTLRQSIVPEQLLGRVQMIAAVLAWSAQPLGAMAGAWLLVSGVRISPLYGGIGIAVLLLVLAGSFGALGRPDSALLGVPDSTTSRTTPRYEPVVGEQADSARP